MKTLKLVNSSKNLQVAARVRVASGFFERAKGLLGESGIESGTALWIQGSRFVGCNSVHTWFMRFAIDVVFVDRSMIVKRVYEDLGPWRMTLPAYGAVSVFELPAGTLKSKPVDIGDQLNVVGD
jgi:uncharacterized membrane protein (UPF0127 family)